MATIITKDTLRASVEAATGGLVTVLYDEGGHPSYMRRIPKCKIEDVCPDLGLAGTHPAFIVNGVESRNCSSACIRRPLWISTASVFPE